MISQQSQSGFKFYSYMAYKDEYGPYFPVELFHCSVAHFKPFLCIQPISDVKFMSLSRSDSIQLDVLSFVACALLSYADVVALTASSWYISLLTAERFIVVWFPMKVYLRVHECLVFTVVRV